MKYLVNRVTQVLSRNIGYAAIGLAGYLAGGNLTAEQTATVNNMVEVGVSLVVSAIAFGLDLWMHRKLNRKG